MTPEDIKASAHEVENMQTMTETDRAAMALAASEREKHGEVMEKLAGDLVGLEMSLAVHGLGVVDILKSIARAMHGIRI